MSGQVLSTYYGILVKMQYKNMYLSTLVHTANVYRQTTDKLMFKSVISTVRWMRK